MPAFSEQHFVPQYYFRRFSECNRRIHVCLRKTGRIIPNASVRHQCCGRRFYGSPEIERVFQRVDADHAEAIRVLADATWAADWAAVNEKVIVNIWNAVLFQRSRTQLEVDKRSHVPTALFLPEFREFIAQESQSEERDTILGAIDNRQVRIVQSPIAAVLQAIEAAASSSILISDLEWCVFRNLTEYPFIFGDAPVVYYNSLLRDVTERGVLGLQSPGLQMFYPIDRDMLLMMYDAEAYRFTKRAYFDIRSASDVSQLNALQLHHSRHAIYFGSLTDEEYVRDLWQAHRHKLKSPQFQIKTRRNWIVDGNVEPRPILHILEPHLNIRLRLSFLPCAPLGDSEYHFRHRSPSLVREHRARLARQEDANDDDCDK